MSGPPGTDWLRLPLTDRDREALGLCLGDAPEEVPDNAFLLFARLFSQAIVDQRNKSRDQPKPPPRFEPEELADLRKVVAAASSRFGGSAWAVAMLTRDDEDDTPALRRRVGRLLGKARDASLTIEGFRVVAPSRAHGTIHWRLRPVGTATPSHGSSIPLDPTHRTRVPDWRR